MHCLWISICWKQHDGTLSNRINSWKHLKLEIHLGYKTAGKTWCLETSLSFPQLIQKVGEGEEQTCRDTRVPSRWRIEGRLPSSWFWGSVKNSFAVFSSAQWTREEHFVQPLKLRWTDFSRYYLSMRSLSLSSKWFVIVIKVDDSSKWFVIVLSKWFVDCVNEVIEVIHCAKDSKNVVSLKWFVMMIVSSSAQQKW